MKLLRILGWAIFLGASWTWCIGMYLPVLLVRDYGIWAFVVFAIPNVVGAAAMAWVLPDAEASRKLVEKHRAACEWFSLITVLFHIYFIFWILDNLLGANTISWPLIAVVIVGIGTPVRSISGRITLSATILACSIIIAYDLWQTSEIPHLPPPVAPSANLIWLALACLFGLTLCPYLDLTFHQARQETTPTLGRIAFAFGFGVVFAAMLLFSIAYSGWLVEYSQFIPGVMALTAISIHILAQSMLKLSLHTWSAMPRLGLISGTAAAASGVLMLAKSYNVDAMSYHGLSVAELGYRCFMSFYGLFFPAYVWVCIFNKKPWRMWIIAVLLAAPMYWMGFIERQMIWLLPGVAVPFIAGLLPISRARQVPSEPSPS